METSVREVTTLATLEEKKKLRKEFKNFDMTFITIAAIIGLDTIGAVSANGGQALTWLLISAVTFLLPYGLLISEIGTTFPQEGGVYEWCKMASGRYVAALAATLYWISRPLWIGGTLAITAIGAISLFFFGNINYQVGGSTWANAIFRIVVALIFIWGIIWSAILSLHVGKWLCVIGSYAKFGLIALFAVLAIWFFAGGHATGEHMVIGDLAPASPIFIAVIPILIFQWVGFELQNGAGEEMVNPQRDVPRSIIRSGVFSVIGYTVLIAAVLFTLSKSQLTNVGSFLTAYKAVDTVLGPLAAPVGWLVAIAFVFGLASSGGSWVIGADRTYAIASLDRTAPAIFGRFSGRYGTPIFVNTMTGIVASIAMIAAVVITAFGSGSIVLLFGLVLGFVISTTTLSYLFIFPSYLILRYKYPNVRRPYKVPGGMLGAWIVCLLPLAYAAVASFFILWPTDATIATNNVTRFTYEMTQFVPLAIIVLLTTVLYIWGHAEKSNTNVVVDYSLVGEFAYSLSGVGSIGQSSMSYFSGTRSTIEDDTAFFVRRREARNSDLVEDLSPGASTLSLFALARANLEDDDKALVSKNYSIEAGISQSKPETFSGEPFDLIVSNTNKPLFFDILLHASKNIELTKWQQNLRYDPRVTEPQLVEFLFRAKSRGHHALDLSFYYERRWLRTIHFEFEAVDQPQPFIIVSEG